MTLKHDKIAKQAPEHCGRVMVKAGAGWSGRHKAQRWRCNVCGYRTLKGAFPGGVASSQGSPRPKNKGGRPWT